MAYFYRFLAALVSLWRRIRPGGPAQTPQLSGSAAGSAKAGGSARQPDRHADAKLHDPIMVTLNLRGKIYGDDAIEYRQNQGYVGGHSVGPAGVEAVERKLRELTGNPAKVCHGNALVWFRASRPATVVTFDEMWSEMQRTYGLKPVGKNHPDQYGRSENWLKTSPVLDAML